jgi:hypothetical protein
VAELEEIIAAFDAPVPDALWSDLESAGVTTPLSI